MPTQQSKLIDMMTEDPFLQSAYVPGFKQNEKEGAGLMIPGIGTGYQFNPADYYGVPQVAQGQTGTSPGWGAFGGGSPGGVPVGGGGVPYNPESGYYSVDNLPGGGPPGEAFGNAGDMSQNAVNYGWLTEEQANKIGLSVLKGISWLIPPVKPVVKALDKAGAFNQAPNMNVEEAMDILTGMGAAGGDGSMSLAEAMGILGAMSGGYMSDGLGWDGISLGGGFGGAGVGGGSLGGAPGAGMSGAPGADGGFGFGFGM